MKRNKFYKLVSFFLVVLVVSGLFCFKASAEAAYQTYNYTTDKEETASPDIYAVSDVIYGALLPCGTFEEAQDLFIDAQDRVYILDSYNSRVIMLNKNYELDSVLSEMNYNGETVTLAQGAEGIFFHDITQKLYIADTNNNRIIVCDREGNVSNIFEKPTAPTLDEKIEYKPSKIIVDNNNNMYVISKNVNTGAIMTDQYNDFIGFFGINPVKETAIMKAEKLWKKLIGKSDYSFQPVAVNNLFWGQDNFVYSVSTRNEYLVSEVCKLNALGVNVFDVTEFGDVSEKVENIEIFDVSVDSNGFFSVLDRYNGKIYCYDTECNLIGAFGGLGDKRGLYKVPNALAYNSKGDLLVLDAEKNNLTVLSKTEYYQKVYDALVLFLDGQYAESIEPLDEVLKINTNFNLLYTAKGKADMMLGNYDDAVDNFEFGNHQENYSVAKQAKRNKTINDNFTLVTVLIVAIILALVFIDKVIMFVKFCFKKIVRRKKNET